MSEVAEKSDVKLEDILKSIRGIIDDHNQNPVKVSAASEPAVSQESDNKVRPNIFIDQDNVLELTELVPEEGVARDTSLASISQKTKNHVESQINELVSNLDQEAIYPSNEVSMNSLVSQLVQPLVRDWLDNNLPRIVERAVSEEIQKIIPKK